MSLFSQRESSKITDSREQEIKEKNIKERKVTGPKGPALNIGISINVIIEIDKNVKIIEKEDNHKYYLFKSGMFYIFLDEDAKDISKVTVLKLINLNMDIV